MKLIKGKKYLVENRYIAMYQYSEMTYLDGDRSKPFCIDHVFEERFYYEYFGYQHNDYRSHFFRIGDASLEHSVSVWDE